MSKCERIYIATPPDWGENIPQVLRELHEYVIFIANFPYEYEKVKRLSPVFDEIIHEVVEDKDFRKAFTDYLDYIAPIMDAFMNSARANFCMDEYIKLRLLLFRKLRELFSINSFIKYHLPFYTKIGKNIALNHPTLSYYYRDVRFIDDIVWLFYNFDKAVQIYYNVGKNMLEMKEIVEILNRGRLAGIIYEPVQIIIYRKDDALLIRCDRCKDKFPEMGRFTILYFLMKNRLENFLEIHGIDEGRILVEILKHKIAFLKTIMSREVKSE